MKNVFFALAFMIVGSSAFANTTEVETLNGNIAVEIINSEATSELEELLDCVDVTFSCGHEGAICGDSLSEIIYWALVWDNEIC